MTGAKTSAFVCAALTALLALGAAHAEEGRTPALSTQGQLATGAAAGLESQARAALAAAFHRADQEAQASPRLSFTETVAEKGVTVSARFDPATPNRWTPITAAASAQERKSLEGIYSDTPDERDLFLHRIRSSLSGTGSLVSSHDGVSVFDFAMARTARPTGTLLDQVADLQSRIRVQLTVDAHTQTFTAMRFYAPAPFHATPIAKVDHVELNFTFGPSYAGGPTVVRRITTDVRYSIATAEAVVRDTVWFSDVAPRAGLALGAGP